VVAPDPETEAPNVSYLVEFPTRANQTVFVEIEDEQLAGFAPAAAPGDVVTTSATSLEDALDRLLPTLQAIGDRLKTLAPDECTIELGVKLTAEAGVIISKASAEANFTLTLKWAKDAGKPSE
jgi:hypothetical protein